jgi:transcriptional regulator with XRE-family HTH domain
MLLYFSRKEELLMNERIKRIRNSLNISQTDFAQRLSISRSAVCKMESGENYPSEQTIKLICNEFSVNEEWLRTGKGEMFIEKSKDEQIAEMLADIQTGGEDTFKHRLVSALSKLNKEDWESLEKLIDLINKE